MSFPQFPPPIPQGGINDRWRRDDAHKWIIAGGCDYVMLNGRIKASTNDLDKGIYIMSDVSEAYDKATNIINKTSEAYNSAVAKFRAIIGNDLTSISASANKVLAETKKMQLAYNNIIGTLTSPEMERSIVNAERLAKALESMSALQSHSITFAVLDKKPAA